MLHIYLDHTATTPLDPRVLEAMTPYFSDVFGNASSIHRFGREAKAAMEQARERIARAIGADPPEVFFTSGGTESDNLAIRGVIHAGGSRDHLVTSVAEHHAVLETAVAVQEDRAGSVTFLPVDEFGVVSAEQVRDAFTGKTLLVSLMHSNNEVGSINPLEEIVPIAHEHGVMVHSDAVQSIGKVPLNVGDLGVDLMSLSAHKVYGPKGIGALYVRKGTPIDPVLSGGGQERGRRPGTENVPLVVGFATAIDLAVQEMEAESVRLARLRDELERRIRNEFPAAVVNGHPRQRLPHILNVSFDSTKIRLEGEMLLMNMDLRGIALTSGSACTSGSMQPSHVLLAMGRDAATAKATLRFAFGRGNTADQLDVVVQSLHDILGQMTL